jgi:hypothetical protein
MPLWIFLKWKIHVPTRNRNIGISAHYLKKSCQSLLWTNIYNCNFFGERARYYPIIQAGDSQQSQLLFDDGISNNF